jgi:two-component system, cell cycle sensor histidine kinase and response regulator CckA
MLKRRQSATAPFERPGSEPDTRAPARLVVMAGARAGMRYAFTEQIVIGRGESVDVLLDDTEVSRKHARLYRDDEGAFQLEDLGSRNGTFLNGLQVKKNALRFGDRITVGQHTLLFTQLSPEEENLRQRDRLAALGRISAGVAHDLNNMLGAIAATVDFLARISLTDEAKARECLRDLEQAVKRASALTPRLVAFARSESQGHGPVDLSAVCAEVVELVRRAFGSSINVESQIEPGLALTGDGVDLHQALMNLCFNARDAMPRGGKLSITAKRIVAVQAEKLGLTRELHAQVTVEDTGVGMDETTRARVFEPFFTTKGRYGTGLGLAMVAEVVQLHGGEVEVASGPDKGSRFDMFLPMKRPWSDRSMRETGPKQKPVRPDPRPPQERTILLADDEPSVRRGFARLLRHEGYEVLEVADGAEAVALYQGHEKKPDLVILDVRMPNLDGIEALKMLRSIDRRARVMMISGHLDASEARELRARGAIELIAKPCPAAVLLPMVAAALGPGAGEEADNTGQHAALDPDTEA